MSSNPQPRSDIQLLEHLVVGNDDLEKLESLLDEFNAFEAIGAVRSELRHSDFLSFLLDPYASHRLGDDVLKAFLKKVLITTDLNSISAIDIDVYDLTDAEVRREWKNLDLCILSDTNKLAIAIENKIDSGESKGQLSQYAEVMTTEFPTHQKILIYLTPQGDRPSEPDWVHFGYSELIETIERVTNSNASTMGQDVKVLCDHYATMVRRHIVSESETAELCRKLYKRHKQAFDLIFEHKPDLQADLFETLRTLVISMRSELELDHSTKKNIRFAVKAWDQASHQLGGSGWTKSKRVLLFEFQNFEESLTLKLYVGPGDQQFRELIWKIAKAEKAKFPGCSLKLYDKWTQILVLKFLSKKDYEQLSVEQLEEKIRIRWDKFISEDYKKIRNVMDTLIL